MVIDFISRFISYALLLGAILTFGYVCISVANRLDNPTQQEKVKWCEDRKGMPKFDKYNQYQGCN